MAETLSLNCIVNTPALPVTGSPRLVYSLLEVSGSTDTDALPVNLAIVVDTSDSMHFRLATEAQFKKLAQMGLLQEVLVDGVPAWQSEEIPNEVLTHLPRKIDRVRDALWAAVEQLRPAATLQSPAPSLGRCTCRLPGAVCPAHPRRRVDGAFRRQRYSERG